MLSQVLAWKLSRWNWCYTWRNKTCQEINIVLNIYLSVTNSSCAILHQGGINRCDDHDIADLIVACHIYHPVYHFMYCHRDVDWTLLSLVMWNDRCTWLASCYVTHIRFHWEKIHESVMKFWDIAWICVKRRIFFVQQFLSDENGYV